MFVTLFNTPIKDLTVNQLVKITLTVYATKIVGEAIIKVATTKATEFNEKVNSV